MEERAMREQHQPWCLLTVHCLEVRLQPLVLRRARPKVRVKTLLLRLQKRPDVGCSLVRVDRVVFSLDGHNVRSTKVDAEKQGLAQNLVHRRRLLAGRRALQFVAELLHGLSHVRCELVLGNVPATREERRPKFVVVDEVVVVIAHSGHERHTARDRAQKLKVPLPNFESLVCFKLPPFAVTLGLGAIVSTFRAVVVAAFRAGCGGVAVIANVNHRSWQGSSCGDGRKYLLTALTSCVPQGEDLQLAWVGRDGGKVADERLSCLFALLPNRIHVRLARREAGQRRREEKPGKFAGIARHDTALERGSSLGHHRFGVLLAPPHDEWPVAAGERAFLVLAPYRKTLCREEHIDLGGLGTRREHDL
mmetsp:Transcript_4561/g.14460  ORF Transcript_4561/g.14460 Transcript_4561/m.14460 type:complete len:363 (+) Transcript_4561:1091-2179(+)